MPRAKSTTARSFLRKIKPGEWVAFFAFVVSLSSLAFNCYQFNKTSALNRKQADANAFHNEEQLRISHQAATAAKIYNDSQLTLAWNNMQRAEKQFEKNQQLTERQLSELILHDKLSVRPVLTIQASFGEDASYIGFWIANNGLGPAQLKQVSYYYKRAKVGGVLDIVDSLYADSLDFWPSDALSVNMTNTGVMSPGEKIMLLFTKGRTLDFKSYTKAIQAINNVRIQAKYQDAYGDGFMTPLNWDIQIDSARVAH